MLPIMSPAVRLTVSDILKQRNISTRKFADMAKLTYGQALAMQRGVYTRIDLDVLGRVSVALNVPPGDLFVADDTEAT